jgi:hypothetical protein
MSQNRSKDLKERSYRFVPKIPNFIIKRVDIYKSSAQYAGVVSEVRY